MTLFHTFHSIKMIADAATMGTDFDINLQSLYN